ncbi:hypothetical protein [Thermoanaerobacter sp. A7A]|uniref:hypothetical protein n=1 Tax=Thermoanaerobacter sp. A7A TaxID=1350366 RepID=UPI00042189B9|nr:hypothetical protein [Thermoanaerobacter sp. A7A]
MPRQKQLTPKSAYRAIQYLANEIYKFDKKYEFDIPNTKKELREYAEELRFLVEETIKISAAPVMKPIDWVYSETQKRWIHKKKLSKQEKEDV